LPLLTKKYNESKLEIIKSIIDRNPFGYTLMEIYSKYKSEHGIGSRNTLKKYLNILVETGDVETHVLGAYRLYRSKNKVTFYSLFKKYPLLETTTINFFIALSQVLGPHSSPLLKQIGIEFAKKTPLLESKVIQQFKKFKQFLKMLPFKQFIQKFSEQILVENQPYIDTIMADKEARLILTKMATLQKRAWGLIYVLAGILEYYMNEIFNQNVTVTIDSISTTRCVIKIAKNPL